MGLLKGLESGVGEVSEGFGNRGGVLRFGKILVLLG